MKGYKLHWRKVPLRGPPMQVIPSNDSNIIWFPSEDRYGIDNYGNNIDTTMVIKSDGVSKIQLAFSEFQTEVTADYVEITYDGQTTKFEGNYNTVGFI